MLQMGNCLKSKNQIVENTNQQVETNKAKSKAKKENKENLNNDSKIVISVVGLDDSGKTTLVKALRGDKDLKDVVTTVGYEPHQIKYNSKHNIVLYDLGGASRVRDIWKHYLAESYGFIFVIDSSNRNRLNESRSVFSSFIESEKVWAKPFLILGNKQDQANSLDESEIVQYLNIEELANKFQIPCRVETCTAISGSGKKMDKSIKTGFEWLFKHIQTNIKYLKERTDNDVQAQKSEETKLKRERSERIRAKWDKENPGYDEKDDEREISNNPWKRLDEMKLKDSNSKTTPNVKLTPYERQLIDEMETGSKSRLTTINEENKNKSKPFRNNKLVPLDDRAESDIIKTKSSASWALVDPPVSKKNALPALSYRSKYDVF